MGVKQHWDAPSALACIGFLICWSIAPIYIELLTGYVDSWTQNFLRYGVSFVFWVPFLLVHALRKGVRKSLFLRALIPTGFNILTQSCYAGAFYYADPGFITLITLTMVFWVSLFSMLLFRPERSLLRSAAFWTGSILSIAGAAGVVIFHPEFSAHTTLKGTVLASCMALGWSCYAVSVKAFLGDTDARLSFSVITVYTVIGLGVLAFVLGRPRQCLEMGPMQWSYVAISALTGIAFGHTMYYSAIRRIGASIPTLFMLLRPFLVLLISAMVFAEKLTALQWLFGLILITGSGFFIRARSCKPNEK